MERSHGEGEGRTTSSRSRAPSQLACGLPLTSFMRLLPGAAPDRDALEPSIYRFVLRYSLGEQILLVVLTLLSFPVLYYSLELPKVIINQAIGGKHFPRQILGAEIAQIPYLLVLCAGFLVLVIVNGWFKYYINVRKGQLGERLLRRLRFELCDRILRFPLPAFGHLSAGGVIAMVTAELEPLGEFIGDAFALPIFQAGTLATTLAFMFVQDPALGGAAVLLYPVQGYVIPKLQRKVRQLGRERVRMMRSLADRIGETIAGRVDIRANDAAAAQLAELSAWLGRIYTIRFDIYNRKFFAKFLNNFINQLTPFFFLAIGGYFVIEGRLSLGALEGAARLLPAAAGCRDQVPAGDRAVPGRRDAGSPPAPRTAGTHSAFRGRHRRDGSGAGRRGRHAPPRWSRFRLRGRPARRHCRAERQWQERPRPALGPAPRPDRRAHHHRRGRSQRPAARRERPPHRLCRCGEPPLRGEPQGKSSARIAASAIAPSGEGRRARDDGSRRRARACRLRAGGRHGCRGARCAHGRGSAPLRSRGRSLRARAPRPDRARAARGDRAAHHRRAAQAL